MLCYFATLLLCYFATLLLCYFATLLLCYFATLLLCYFATLLIKQLTDLDLLIPYNTTAEKSWLEKEKLQSTGSTERFISFVSSPIFAKFWLKDRIGYTCDLLKENLSSGISLKRETLNWINISLILMPKYNAINESLSILVRNHIVNKSKLKKLISYATSNAYIFSDFDSFGREILQLIVPKLIRADY